jgi:hypothetical protein
VCYWCCVYICLCFSGAWRVTDDWHHHSGVATRLSQAMECPRETADPIMALPQVVD